MSSPQIKELFGAMVAGAPADSLDVDLAIVVGRRRRRVRASAALASAAAVVAVIVGFALGLPRLSSTPDPRPISPTPTPSLVFPTPTRPVVGSPEEWQRAIWTAMPYRDQLTIAGARVDLADPPHEVSSLLKVSISAQAGFLYVDAGRTTALVARADAPGAYTATGSTDEARLLSVCPSGASGCEIQQTSTGPVLVWRGGADVRSAAGDLLGSAWVSAAQLRKSGVLVTVTSYNAGALRYGVYPQGGGGAPGLAADLPRLAGTVAALPEPALMTDYAPMVVTPPSDPVSTPGPSSTVVPVRSGVPLDIGAGASATFDERSACVRERSSAGKTCAPEYYRGGGGEQAILWKALRLSDGRYAVVGRYGLGAEDIHSVVITMDGVSRTATIGSFGPGKPPICFFVVMPSAATSAATVEIWDSRRQLVAQSSTT